MQHSNTIAYCATTGNDGQITPSRRFATLLLLLRRIMLTGLLWRQTELFLWCCVHLLQVFSSCALQLLEYLLLVKTMHSLLLHWKFKKNIVLICLHVYDSAVHYTRPVGWSHVARQSLLNVCTLCRNEFKDRTYHLSDWCALQEALYTCKCIHTIWQYVSVIAIWKRWSNFWKC